MGAPISELRLFTVLFSHPPRCLRSKVVRAVVFHRQQKVGGLNLARDVSVI